VQAAAVAGSSSSLSIHLLQVLIFLYCRCETTVSLFSIRSFNCKSSSRRPIRAVWPAHSTIALQPQQSAAAVRQASKRKGHNRNCSQGNYTMHLDKHSNSTAAHSCTLRPC
jgi:hypothetical protein